MKRIMWLNFLVVLLFSVGVQNSFAESDPTLDNFININVSGARSGSYNFEGEQAAAAFMGFQDNQLQAFSLVASNDMGLLMQTGGFTLQLSQKEEQAGSELAQLNFNAEGDEWRDVFNSQFYPLYYDTSADGSESKTYVTLTKVEQLAEGYLLLEGNFRFNAASGPETHDIPKAALHDAQANAGRRPPYQAELAGSASIKVSGNFRVAVLVKPFGW